MANRREVFGPDGRAWVVTRRVDGTGLAARVLHIGPWLVEATTDGPPAEVRHWSAPNRVQAMALLEEVAMSLRTGAEGPNEADEADEVDEAGRDA